MRPPRAATHLHTKTSSGARVLGVMIQGATRKTTVSVKIGISSKPCKDGGGHKDGPSLPPLCVKPSPIYGVTFSGLSSSVTWKDTSPEKLASGKESPSTKKMLSSWCRLGFTA